MDDLTYNQGIHGAQDQANALVRSGLPFSVLTGDWRSPEFATRFEDWARAARAVMALRRTSVALLGYPMNGMGDILPDLNFTDDPDLKRLGEQIKKSLVPFEAKDLRNNAVTRAAVAGEAAEILESMKGFMNAFGGDEHAG